MSQRTYATPPGGLPPQSDLMTVDTGRAVFTDAYAVIPRATMTDIVLIALPHLIAAPHPEAFAGVAPPEMAALFAARALGVGAIAWALLGGTAGWFWQRQAA